VKIREVHERTIAARPKKVAALVADFETIWPTRLLPAPRELEAGRYQAGFMVWEEVERPGAVRAFHVVSPEGLQVEHWFELEGSEGGTLVRHTIDGEVFGKYEAIWRERVKPVHGVIFEAVLDNIEAAVT
jgi:hypothetical protein